MSAAPAVVTLVLTPTIDIVAANAAELRAEWLTSAAEGAGPVIVDLSGVQMVDSSGLGMLIQFRSSLTSKNRSLSLVCTSDQLRTLFRITRVENQIRIFKTLEEARTALGS